MARKITRSGVKKAADKAFNEYIRARSIKVHGNKCQIGGACKGYGAVECAYHVIRKSRGDAIRYHEDGVVGACRACNYAEHYHPHLYEDHYIRKYGQAKFDELKAVSRQEVHYSTKQLIELADHYRKMKQELING